MTHLKEIVPNRPDILRVPPSFL